MSNLQQCEAGRHFYNVVVYENCPQCEIESSQGESAAPNSDKKTVEMPKPNQEGRTEVIHDRGVEAELAGTKPVRGRGKSSDSSSTTILYSMDKANDKSVSSDDLPAAGWLVIVEGSGLGKDFRLIQASNAIGRDKAMEVCLDLGSDSDESISREAHAIVVYDNHANEFFIERGKSRNLPTVNGKTIRGSQDLKSKDIIQVGGTKLMFVPLCDDSFSWSEEKSS